jgi:hypothetical protein
MIFDHIQFEIRFCVNQKVEGVRELFVTLSPFFCANRRLSEGCPRALPCQVMSAAESKALCS